MQRPKGRWDCEKMATGNDFIQVSMNDLGENLSGLTELQQSRYPSHVRQAMDLVARRSWCLRRMATTDIIAGQVQYDFPLRPFREMAINVNDGYGNIWPVTSITPERADQLFPNWRAAQNTSGSYYEGVPRYFIESGPKVFSVLPVPNYSVMDGIMIEGYFGVGDWYSMDMESPLDQSMDWVIGLGTKWLRCREMKSIDPVKYRPLEQDYVKDFDGYIRMTYREALAKTASRRAGVTSDKSNRYSCVGGWGWY